MNNPKKDIYAAAIAAGKKASLTNKEPKAEETPSNKSICRKQLGAVPVSYVDAHAKLKADRKTSLDFSNYVYEALREKLERDGAL